MASPTASDYGSELDYADDALEAQLAAAERATVVAPPVEVERAQHVDIAFEDQQEQLQAAGNGTLPSPGEALAPQGIARENLWERFRKWRGWGTLSVSDLTGPSWCEWQHSYRLLTKPHLPPLARPATITTASGATIEVDTERTVKREGMLDRGRAVHAKIEREVMGPVEEVKVEVQGKEEWWALRILNTATCLETLFETGRVREVPVVGWVGDFLVFGVCDEIERREVHLPPSPVKRDGVPASTPPRPATPTTSKKDQQSTLKQIFSPVALPSQSSRSTGKARADDVVDLTSLESEEEPVARPSWCFVLSDTKTRFNRSIPAEAESRPARLQLMLYHRLLLSFLRPSTPSPPPSGPPPFSWPRLYTHHSLSPDIPLSPAFLSSIAPLLVATPAFAHARTLQDFVDVLGRYGELLGGDDWLGPEMEISYRLREDEGEGGGRGGRGKRWRGRRGKRKREGEDAAAAEEGNKRREEEPDAAQAARDADEEEDLRRAIELSLQDPPAVDAGAPAQATSAAAPPTVAVATESADTVDSQLEDSQLPFLANPSLPLPLPAPPTSAGDTGDESDTSPLFGLADAFALPLNSQSDPPADPAPSGRYNLRRRRPAASTSAPVGTPPAPPAVSSPRAGIAASSATAGQPSAPAPSSPSPEPADPSFIGTTTFVNSPRELNAWLSSVLSYWRSERAPVGVAPSETRRCRTCEFEEGCEWRAEKAREAAEAARQRRQERTMQRVAEGVGARG